MTIIPLAHIKVSSMRRHGKIYTFTLNAVNILLNKKVPQLLYNMAETVFVLNNNKIIMYSWDSC
jgi:hypothetical protein